MSVALTVDPRRAITERDFQTWVEDVARMCHWRYYHTHNARHSAPGFPDLVLVRNGRVIFAELKRDDAEPTYTQELWLDALRDCPGIEVYVWHPRDQQEVTDTLYRAFPPKGARKTERG